MMQWEKEARQAANNKSHGLFMLLVIVAACVWFLACLLGVALGWFPSPLRGLILAASPLLFLALFFKLTDTPARAGQNRRKIGGASVESASKPQSGEGLLLGSVRLPFHVEPQHIIAEGAPGTGKTQLLKQFIAQVLERGDKVVVIDSQFEFFNTFADQYGGTILSPFDDRSPGWLPQNEVRTSTDWNALAETLIAKGEGNSAEWNAMARAFFAAIAKGYHREVKAAGVEFDHIALFRLLTSSSVEEIAPFLEGSAAASLAENEKGLTNVRMSFFESLSFWEDLRPGSFSVRDWVADDNRQNLFIPHTKRTLGAIRTLIATWTDQVVQEACDLGENRDRRVWVIIDELASLGKIPSLEEAAAELRKTGFCLLVACQTVEQLQARYGREGSRAINSNLGTKVWLRVNDPDSAERISRAIGDARHRIEATSVSGEGGRNKRNVSVTDQTERLVLASDIAGMENLKAFVRPAESSTSYYTTIPIFGKDE